MQILITGKGIELTPAIEEYVTKKVNGLEKFYNNIIRAQVVVGVETHHHLKGDIFIAECKLFVPGHDLFVEKKEATLYQAIDVMREYMEKDLKKHKMKEREKFKQEKVEAREKKEYAPSL
jgi:putative sigma-54 modulation protein